MKYKTNTHNWSTCLCSHLYIITHYEGQSSYPPQRAQCEFESPITIRLPLFHWLQLTCKNHGRRKKKEKSSTVHKFQQKLWQSNLDMRKYFFFWGGGKGSTIQSSQIPTSSEAIKPRCKLNNMVILLRLCILEYCMNLIISSEKCLPKTITFVFVLPFKPIMTSSSSVSGFCSRKQY